MSRGFRSGNAYSLPEAGIELMLACLPLGGRFELGSFRFQLLRSEFKPVRFFWAPALHKSRVGSMSQNADLPRLCVQGEWRPAQLEPHCGSRDSHWGRCSQEKTHVEMVFEAADRCLRANLGL